MPTADGWGQGIQLAALTDAPDLPKAVKDLADGIIPRTILRYASASARGAAIASPQEGMATWLTAEGRLEIYHDGDWLPWPPIPVQTFQVSDAPYNVTQAFVDYTSSAWPRPVFVAPPSGRAYVTISAALSNTSTDRSTCWAAWRATGNMGFAYSDSNRTGLSAMGVRIIASRRLLLTGMTPGETITIIPQWNISSGDADTATTFGGALLVEPAP